MSRGGRDDGCTEVQNLLVPFTAGELSGVDAGCVVDHLRECSGCREDLEDGALVSRLLRDHLRGHEPPADFLDRLHARLRDAAD